MPRFPTLRIKAADTAQGGRDHPAVAGHGQTATQRPRRGHPRAGRATGSAWDAKPVRHAVGHSCTDGRRGPVGFHTRDTNPSHVGLVEDPARVPPRCHGARTPWSPGALGPHTRGLLHPEDLVPGRGVLRGRTSVPPSARRGSGRRSPPVSARPRRHVLAPMTLKAHTCSSSPNTLCSLSQKPGPQLTEPLKKCTTPADVAGTQWPPGNMPDHTDGVRALLARRRRPLETRRRFVDRRRRSDSRCRPQ